MLSFAESRASKSRASLGRRFASALFALVCLVFMLAGGGCEAIITADPPGGWSCDATFDAGVCPQGQFCFNSKCIPCVNGNCLTGVGECFTTDKDSDGYFACGHLNETGTDVVDKDCDDNDPTIHPGAAVVCNGRDNNCDGVTDDPCPQGSTCAGKTGECKEGGCTPSSCEAPKVCDQGTKICIVPQSKKLGETCEADTECEKTAFCGYSAHLTADVVPEPPLGKSPTGLCTRACCTSTDCPLDFVCFGAGTGGNYCVAKGALQRPALGTKGAGETCSGRNDECRSGICANGHCEDSCCDSSQCKGDTHCLVTDVHGKGATTKKTLGCVIPPTDKAAIGARCEASAGCGLLGLGSCPPCGEGVCDGSPACRPLCRGSGACGDTATCQKVQAKDKPGVMINACAAISGAKGTKSLGASCDNNGECAGGLCLQGDASNPTKYCSDTCCEDVDCKTETTGLVCRPYDSSATHYLRCVRPAVAAVKSKPVQ